MQSGKVFFQTFLLLALSAVVFLFLKSWFPNKLFSEKPSLTKHVVIDSLLLEAIEEEKGMMKDSVVLPPIEAVVAPKIVFEAPDGIVFPPESMEEFTGYQYLIPYFEKLYQWETQQKGSIRIAYFGDSMTDGDMIVQDLRREMQKRYGGQGVGFVPITSESAASRSSVNHQFSANWKVLSYLNVKKPFSPFGVHGQVFFAKDTLVAPWVQYKAGPVAQATQLPRPTLFYGSSKNKKGEVVVRADKDTLTYKLKPQQLLNTLTLKEGNVKSLKAFFHRTDSIPIYGFNFDDGVGVHIDNFSSRGNSGLPIATFDQNLMQSFHQKLDYDLIVLHYGTNVLNYGSYDYSWYQRNMGRVVKHLKACFPGVAVLVVSTADKSTKYKLEIETDSAVIPLTKAQKNYALQSEAAFFSLFEKMGGVGSMKQWVESDPPMANKDYTHFNFKGAQKVAGMLDAFLEQGYKQYKQLRISSKTPDSKPRVDSSNLTTTTQHAP